MFFLNGVIGELRKVTYPTKDHFYKATIAVFVFVGMSLILIGGIDYLLRNIVSLLSSIFIK